MIKNIIEIDIDKIQGHPNNPRKNLGDLSELSEGIKAQGVLQPLTVVENGVGGYVVVMGHRRLAAARVAGLSVVPCIVACLNEKEQVGVMLMENMQRADLTFVEQAEGFQLMMDLGCSYNDIRSKTGASESTVRRRIKLLNLDRGKLEESVSRGGTLEDYAELDKIKDLSLRNEVLESVGTSNFNWKLKQAIEQEKKDKEIALIVNEVSKFASEAIDGEGLSYVSYLDTLNKVKTPDDVHEVDYFYVVKPYGVDLYKEICESEPDVDEEKQQMDELREWFKVACERGFDLRRDFVKGFSAFKKYSLEIMRFASKLVWFNGYYGIFDSIGFAELMGIELEGGQVNPVVFDELLAKEPEKTLFVSCVSKFNDSSYKGYCDTWTCEYRENAMLDEFYDFLVSLGYEMSDEEKALRDGTHEKLVKKE